MVDNGSVPGFRSVSVEDEFTNFSTFKKISRKGFWLSLKKLLSKCASPCVIFNVWWVVYVDDVTHALLWAVKEGWLLF